MSFIFFLRVPVFTQLFSGDFSGIQDNILFDIKAVGIFCHPGGFSPHHYQGMGLIAFPFH
jgi:hypothetical protein